MCVSFNFLCLIQSNYDNNCNKSFFIHSLKWQKVTMNNQNYHMTKNLCLCTNTLSTLLRRTTCLHRIDIICRNSPMVHEHIEQSGILPILSENKQAPQQCQPLWTKALSNLIYMEDFLNWIWGFGTQKHRGIYEDLLTMYFYITLSLSKVEIMKWEHCWTGKELSAF